MTTVRTLWIIALLALVASGCGDEPAAPADGRLRIAASVFPLADIAREVGGGHVEVVTLLPPGASPHEFEIRPKQVERLSGCRLLLAVGLGMDRWAEDAAAASGREFPVLRFADAVGIVASGASDPHLWLDPTLTKTFATALAERLASLDPAHADDYRAQARVFCGKLDRLDAEYREQLAACPTKAFVSIHPAFTRVAAHYGLEEATLSGSHADEGGPGALEDVIDFVRERGIQVVFAEPQFPAEQLDWLCEQAGVTVGLLDPLGNPNVEGYRTYLEMMRTNLRELVAALSK